MLLIRYNKPEDLLEDKIDDDVQFSDVTLPSSLVFKVVASGKWLDRIRMHFKNLPDIQTGVHEATVSWYGDHAKFIAGNISDVSNAYWDMWQSKER
jgi:hypothetical protein